MVMEASCNKKCLPLMLEHVQVCSGFQFTFQMQYQCFFKPITMILCEDMIRQYEALKSLDCIKTNLKNAVFCTLDESSSSERKPIVLQTPPQPGKPASVIAKVWKIISEQTNLYQLSAIESVMLGKAKENVTLLQGPPGKFSIFYIFDKKERRNLLMSLQT